MNAAMPSRESSYVKLSANAARSAPSRPPRLAGPTASGAARPHEGEQTVGLAKPGAGRSAPEAARFK